MEIFLLKKPYEVSLSGNPIDFSFAITPYGLAQQAQDIRVQVSVLVEQLPGSGIFTEVKNQNFYPTSDGQVALQVQSIIDPYLEYYLPRPTLKKPVVAVYQKVRFKIKWILQKDGALISGPSESSIYYAIKSGLNYESWHPSEFFTTKILAEKTPLLFPAAGEKCGIEEMKYFFWVYPYADGADQIVTYTIYVSDPGTGSFSFNAPAVSGGKWSVFCAPMGYKQMGMDSVAAPNMPPYKWSVQVMAGDVVVVAETFFEIEQRNFYDPKQLMYRNSIGGLETIRLRGQVDMAADYDRQLAQKTLPPSWYANMNLLPQSTDENTEELLNFTGDTGFISKSACDKLRDLFLSKQKVEVIDSRFIPININTKKAKFFSNKDSLISTVIEWSPAFGNNFYTPVAYMPRTRTCPAVQSFIVRQASTSMLQIMYALESPYTLVEVQVIIGTTVYTYTYTGNTQTVMQPFANPATDSPVDITIRARTVCDENSIPVDYGAFSTVTLAVVSDQPPVTVDDVYNISSGYSSPVVLSPSVIDNDYDPDGDAVQAVASFGTGSAGGNYSISIGGVVTYTPPSSGFTGTDTFPYQIFGVIGGPNINGLVTVHVGSGVYFVYAKIVLRGYNSAYSNSGEVWIDFFSNPAGTVPVDVTSTPFTVNYNLHTHYTIVGSIGSIGPADVDTAGSAAATGTKVKIFTGPLYTVYSGGGSIIRHYSDRADTYTMVAGTGYTAL